jgi:hypothetical protein
MSTQELLEDLRSIDIVTTASAKTNEPTSIEYVHVDLSDRVNSTAPVEAVALRHRHVIGHARCRAEGSWRVNLLPIACLSQLTDTVDNGPSLDESYPIDDIVADLQEIHGVGSVEPVGDGFGNTTGIGITFGPKGEVSAIESVASAHGLDVGSVESPSKKATYAILRERNAE